MKLISTLLATIILLMACQSKKLQAVKLTDADRKKQVEIQTTKGVIVVKLYNETPLHRDNFLILVKKRFYDSVLFHRVIKDFMAQAGDPDSKTAEGGKKLGDGGLNYTIPAEFNTNLYHKRGALAAARTNNPTKASSSCQFYLVQGVVFNANLIAAAKQKGRWPASITPAQQQVYTTLGGTPHLDQNYTVFGEIVTGLPVLENIANAATNPGDRPVENIRILSMKLIKPIKVK